MILIVMIEEETGKQLTIEGNFEGFPRSSGVAENLINRCNDALLAIKDQPIATYDPMVDFDAKTEYTLEEFVTIATTDLRRFEKDTNSSKKTWQNWMQSFLGWMSW